MRIVKLLGLCAASIVIVGCAAGTTTVKKVNSVEAIQAQAEVSEAELLNVGIVVFDSNLPESEELREEQNIFPSVREAEARYFPFELRDTMEGTNHWGAVRVLPARDNTVDLLVTGTIQHSDGEVLSVDIVAEDSTGRRWLSKRYGDIASKFSYREETGGTVDPFQDMYNLISNDLYAVKRKMSVDEQANIRTISDLKFAAELSPDAFGEHISVNKKGRVQIARMPAENDPMMARVQRIRQSEYLFVDTVDDQYSVFHQEMGPSYDSWRRFSYEETMALREVKRSARNRALLAGAAILGGAVASSKSSTRTGRTLGNLAVIGGVGLAKTAYDRSKDADIHRQALKELAASFDSEVAPIVMEVEGEVIKLNGSLETQYREWKRILREIYAAETGFPVAESEVVPELETSSAN